MEMEANSLIYVIGAVQALLLALGINYQQAPATTSRRMTTVLLLLMFVLMSYYTLLLNEVRGFTPYIHSLGSAVWMAITPAYYLLLKSILQPRWKPHVKHWFYFVFPLAFLAELVLTLLGLPAWLYLLVGDANRYLDCWMGSFFLSGFYFVSRAIRAQRQSVDQSKHQNLRWFSYALMLVLVIFAGLYLWVREDYVIWFELSLIVLCELFVFMLVFKIFRTASFRQLFDAEKYDNQAASGAEMQALAEQLESIMIATEIYREQGLKLSELAERSGIGTNVLSQLFSVHYASNFYDFVNGYRLRHVERLLLEGADRQYKILALAEESGFKSKTTFYKVFKAKHGVTPARFVREG